jgi:hypothetical protein
MDMYLEACIDASGYPRVTWRAWWAPDAYSGDIMTSVWTGDGWSPEEPVTLNDSLLMQPEYNPDVACGEKGEVWVIWSRIMMYGEYDWDVWVTHSFTPGSPILLVDDDVGDTMEVFYEEELERLGYEYDKWEMMEIGKSPPDSLLEEYDAVVWFTGDRDTNVLSSADELHLCQYLDQGGRLFLSSQDYLSDMGDGIDGVLNDFAEDYLHVADYNNDTSWDTLVGVAGDAIGDSIGPLGMQYPFGNRADFADGDAHASKVFKGIPGGQTSALRYPSTGGSPYRAVFFSFPFEALPADVAYPSNQHGVMERVMSWLFEDTTTGLKPNRVRVGSRGAVDPIRPRPNPCTRGCWIKLEVREVGTASGAEILDVRGRVVRRISVGGTHASGNIEVWWDGQGRDGQPVPAGLYFVRSLGTGGGTGPGKVLILR